MDEAQRENSRLTRRHVAKGAAWSVPAVAVFASAPAYALSGPPPSVVFERACKSPGNSCQAIYRKSYLLVLRVTNNDPDKPIYICNAFLTNVVGTALNFVWVPPPAPNCIQISPGATETVALAFNDSSNSGNQTFSFTLNIDWRHTCPCANDTHGVHPTISTNGTVLGTPPQDCPCPTAN